MARLVSEDPKAPFNPVVVTAACKALCALCKGRVSLSFLRYLRAQPNSEAVGSIYGIQKFGRLLSHENEEVVGAACAAMAAAIEQTPANRKVLVSPVHSLITDHHRDGLGPTNCCTPRRGSS